MSRESQLRISPAVPAIALLSIAVGGSVSLIFGSSMAIWLPLVVLAATTSLLVTWANLYEHDSLSPLALMAYLFIFLYVLRPLYILSTGTIGSARLSEGYTLDDRALAAMTRSLWLLLVALLAGVMVYLLVVLRSGASWTARRLRYDGPQLTLRSRDILLIAVVVTSALALGTYLVLIQQAGGLSSYLNGIATRSKFFFNRSFVTLVNLPLKALLFVTLAAYVTGWRANRLRAIVWSTLLVVILTDFLSGGRAAVITGTIVPCVLITHNFGFRFRRSMALLLLSAGLIFFVSARAGVRDYAFQSSTSQSRTQLIGASFTHLPQTILGGDEAIPFDSLAVLNGATGLPAQTQDGSTYLPILTYLIPRFLWTDKPLGGGNVWFTSTYYPSFFGPDHVETSISGLGEFFANFGATGMVLGLSILLGIVALAYRRIRQRPSARAIVHYSVGMGYLITLIRGDAFHSVTNWLVTVILIEVAWRIIVSPHGEKAIRLPSLDGVGASTNVPRTALVDHAHSVG